jgi:hypothetical protein
MVAAAYAIHKAASSGSLNSEDLNAARRGSTTERSAAPG